MLRITFEILPGGSEERKRTIGLMELANVAVHANGCADYAVVMKKTPPFSGALRQAWKAGRVTYDDRHLNAVIAGDDDELVTALATGHHRTRRGVYDLLFRAMRACGLEARQ